MYFSFLFLQCGSLNVIDPHKLIVGGTIRRCDFVRESVTVGVELEVSYAQAMHSETAYFLLPMVQDVELSAPSPALCLPARHHAAVLIMD